MNAEIIKFIKKYGISELEIDDMLNIAPMLEVQSFEDFMANCTLLVKYGYPKIDLDVLLLSNPNIFAISKKDLEAELKELKSKYGDIEEILKENPFII